MDKDDWGVDPQVRYMRRIFARIESAQEEFLRSLKLSPLDDRLRRWREAALKLFEKTWMLSIRSGATADEAEASKIYLHCLAHFLKMNRIEVPPEILPGDDNIDRIVKEALK